MPSIVESGSQAFLHQAYRNNWQRYLAALPERRQGQARLPGLKASRDAWDLCILSASDAHQARMVESQLEWRRSAGLLPGHTRFLVIADPGGQRIGSGGATLRILAALYGVPGAAAEPELAALAGSNAREQRILVIHSGGDSRRLPHCSATGKLFARIPHVLPDGRASTIFDELMVNLNGVAVAAPPGLLLVAGDVLLVFDHLQLSLLRAGVTGIAVAVPAETGVHHGVYLPKAGTQQVQAFLHKSPMPELIAAGAVDAEGRVGVDTGLVWFDAATATQVARLAADPSVAACCGLAGGAAASDTPLNLYGDLLLPLAPNTTEAAYLEDASDGPPTPALAAARRRIWAQLRGTPFSVQRCQPAVFVHFGTSAEYWQMVAADPVLAAICDWSPRAAAWVAAPAPRTVVAVNALLEGSQAGDQPLLVVDSRLAGGVSWHGRSIVAGVHSEQPLALAGDLVLHQLPVAGGMVTRLYGLLDDPKHARTDPRATFLNRPWAEWLAAAAVEPAALWPDLPETAQTLWNARLFPQVSDRDESLRLALLLAEPAGEFAALRDAWLRLPRLSLAESFHQADSGQIYQEMAALEDEIAARGLLQAIDEENPATAVAQRVASLPGGRVLPRLQRVEAALQARPLLVQARGYKALELMGYGEIGEDRAFAALARLVQEQTPRRLASWPAALPPGAGVRVAAAARIDFGGGWTDTPPYSIERGGTVLNAAITLLGQHPIVVEATWLDEPRLVLESQDIGQTLMPSTVGELQSYTNPADPFALVKAALVMVGLVPQDYPADMPAAALMAEHGRGLRLATQTHIPRGSGLGTSSILAGAVLAALASLLGRPLEQEELFDQVLCLEQLLTTGGGWQDQAGGLVGGIHLVASAPGLPQVLRVTPLDMTPSTESALARRLLLVYTGQQRLAKNLLRAVMGRWLAREPEMVALLQAIAQLAHQMATALHTGDLDQFGALLAEHWECNKRMDPHCTNPFIDDLFTVMGPHMAGAKLAGAGGGGFAIVLARSEDAVPALARTLAARYADTPVSIWASGVAARGLVVDRFGR